MYASHTYSCVDMCTSYNQYWSCDHPKQMLPHFVSALVNLDNTALLPTHGYELIMFFGIHDSVNYKILML